MAEFLQDEAEKTYTIVMAVAKCAAEQLARATLTDLDLAGAVLEGIERDLGVHLWAAISPWEFVAAMPTIFAICRQSGNAAAWFEQVTARAAAMHGADHPLTSDEVVQGLLHGVDPNAHRQVFARLVQQIRISLHVQVISAMVLSLDVSDAEIASQIQAAVTSNGPHAQLAREELVARAPALAGRIRKQAARAVAWGVSGKVTPREIARVLEAQLTALVPPEARAEPDVPQLIAQLSATFTSELLRRLTASGRAPSVWCQDFERRVDGGTWAQPLRKSSRR